MAKKVTGFLKLQVPAGAANPSPPIGPALGQRGLAIMDFCKQFNAATAKMEKGMPIPVVITTYADRSFSFELKTPPVSYFIKKAAKLESGSKTPGRDKAGAITRTQVKEIARAEDEGPQLRYHRLGHEDGCRFRPLHGHRGHGVIAMTNLGKRTTKVREGIDREKLYSIDEAVKMIKDRAKAKFDETIEIAMNLGVDPRHADQMVRGVVLLPNGTGRTMRVGVFARGAKADEARAAGADVVGAEDLVEKVQGGTIDFDRCIATPDLMPLVGPARQGARAPRHDAESEGRHRDDGRHRCGQGRQGRLGRVPGREGRHRAGRRRQGVVRRREARCRTSRHSPTRCRRRSPRAPRAPSSIASRCPRPWARA